MAHFHNPLTRSSRFAINVSAVAAALFIWYAITAFFYPATTLIPSPVQVVAALCRLILDGTLLTHTAASLERVLVGFGLATFAGVSLALAAGYYRNFAIFCKPLIEFLRPIPPIAWIPIAILLFGLGNPSAYFIVFIGAFFPIFTNSYLGVESLPSIYVNVARSFELKRYVFIKDILFKFSLPYIFAGLKVGIGMAWMSVIAAELIGAQSGLGYFIQLNRLLLRTDNVVAGMAMIGFVGFLLNWLISVVAKYAMPWHLQENHA